ncbi:MAG TPA: FMN-binding protein, partial [Chloroflexota bacterium]
VVYDQYGPVQATITVTGRRITNVSISAPMGDPRSADINSQAVPILQSETLQAQNANVNTVSGATETSDAYAQSLQAAVAQANL